MKNLNMRSAFSILAFVCLISPILLHSQNNFNKTLNKDFEGINYINIEHRRGPLVVSPSTNGKTQLKVDISFQAESEADAQIVFKNILLDAKDQGDRLTASTRFETQSWVTNNGNSKIKFKNGDRVKNIKKLKISMTLLVPEVEDLTLSNKYHDIIISDGVKVKNENNIQLYSGVLKVGNLFGPLQLNLKYSKAYLKNIKDGNLELYDANISLEDAENLTINSKYSDILIGNGNNLTLKCYDDKLKAKDFKGNIEITDKYSDLEIGSFNNARMDLYDTDLILGSGNDLQVKSKYSEFRIQQLNSLNFELSYDDDLYIQKLNSIAAESKYTKFKIDELNSKIHLESYDDVVDVRRLSGPLEEVYFNCKYSDFNVKLPDQALYRMDAQLTYGTLDYPKSSFESQYYKEKGNLLEIKGRVKSAGEESPLVQLIAYSCDIDLR